MSYIPNSAIPHARAKNDEERSGIDWRSYADEGRRLATRGIEMVRERPREAAAGAVALLAGLAFAGWRASRRKRRFGFA